MKQRTTLPVLRRRAAVFKALGHEDRLRILDELAGGERCVCELVAAVGSSWSTVSRHLSVLKTAGVIADDKRGLQVFYRLALVQPWHRQARRLGALGRRGEETPGLNVGTPLPPFFR